MDDGKERGGGQSQWRVVAIRQTSFSLSGHQGAQSSGRGLESTLGDGRGPCYWEGVQDTLQEKAMSVPGSFLPRVFFCTRRDRHSGHPGLLLLSVRDSARW